MGLILSGKRDIIGNKKLLKCKKDAEDEFDKRYFGSPKMKEGCFLVTHHNQQGTMFILTTKMNVHQTPLKGLFTIFFSIVQISYFG